MWLALARKCILPRLKSWHVEVLPITSLALMVCLSTSVRCFSHVLSAEEVDEEYTIGTALAILKSHKASNLRELTIEEVIPPTSTNHILSFHQLQRLHLASGVSGVFDPVYVPRLSALRHIKDLNLRRHGAAFLNPVPVGEFPSLGGLRIVMNSQNARNLLKAQPPQPSYLLALDLLVDEGGLGPKTMKQFRSFLTDWRRCISVLDYRPPLTHATFIFTDYDQSKAVFKKCADVRFLDLFWPLLSIATMKDFVVGALAGTPLPDEDVFRIASAWPSLVQLSLPTSPEEAQPSLTSIQHPRAALSEIGRFEYKP